MKNGNLYVVVQPGTSNYYWAKNILSGMRQAASEWRDNLRFFNVDDNVVASRINGEYVLIAGNDSGWMEAAICRMMKYGAIP